MNCLEFEQSLPDLLYGEDKEGEAHLLSCPECAKLWRDAREVRVLFKRLPFVAPSPFILQKVSRLAAREASRIRIDWEKLLGWLPHLGFNRGFAPAMVVVLFFVSVLMAVSKPGEKLAEAPSFVALEADPISSTVLRERLWENPFGKSPRPAFKLAASGATQMPNASELQKVYEERRRALLENDADNLLMRGRRLKTMGHMDMALKDFESIYLFYPDYTYMSDVLMFRAQCYAALGRKDKAIESLKLVANRFPDRKDVVAPIIEQLSK